MFRIFYRQGLYFPKENIIILKASVKNATKIAMPKPGFYAVKIGRVPGIYTSWTECEKQVTGFPNAKLKKFRTLELANNYLNENTSYNDLVKLETHATSNQISPQDFSVPDDVEFWSERDFDEDTPQIITSTSELIKSLPKITYSTGARESFYAVHRGRKPGIYRTWTECSKQVEDFRNASYRKFDTEEEALKYVKTGGIQKASKSELINIEFDNKVVKKRKINDNGDSEFFLRNSDDTVIVFTDGASSANGRKISKAGIGVYWGPNHPLNTSKRITGRQTNNRAEIYAAVHALNQAKKIGAKKVKLYTDSQFLIHSITDWIKKWKKNGWKLVTGKDVANKEDFQALDAAQNNLDVEWMYVKAHAKNKGNDEADKLARDAVKLLMTPENCSEFEKVHINSCVTSKTEPFLVTNASIVPKSLILPNVAEKKSFSAVQHGHNPEVCLTWSDSKKQINFPSPHFSKFDSVEQAKEFVSSSDVKLPECKEDKFVTVFTDGACSSNGKDGSQAGIGIFWGPRNTLNTSMRLPGRQTNNRAEIWAAVHALRQAKLLGIKNIKLCTDSQFVINGITTWIIQWKKNNWKSYNGKPVINKDDFIALEEATQGLNIDWCYVKAHNMNPGNVEADQLAVAGCNKPLSDTIILG